jgi:hypothetical protein
LLADQFHAAVAGARTLAEAEGVARLIGRAHAEGHLSDDDAQGLWEAAHARRTRIKAGRPAPLPSPPTGRRRPAPRSPDRQASLARRRRVAASGCLPPGLASAFTQGEVAALAVIGRQCQKSGACRLPIDAIAALAGVCRSTVQNAMRQALALGLIERQERRRRGLPSLTNVVRIVSREWSAWLRLRGGLKNFGATDSSLVLRPETAAATGPERAFRGGEAAKARG